MTTRKIAIRWILAFALGLSASSYAQPTVTHEAAEEDKPIERIESPLPSSQPSVAAPPSPSPTPQAPIASPPPTTGTTPPSDSTTSPVAGSGLSSGEMVTQGRTYVTEMDRTQNHIVKLQEISSRQKDVVKLNCVNDKLVQVRGHIAIANKSVSALNEAISKGDLEQRQHEFTRLTIMYQKVLLLQTEADNCVGEDASYLGTTQVVVEVDPNLPKEEETPSVTDVVAVPKATPFSG